MQIHVQNMITSHYSEKRGTWNHLMIVLWIPQRQSEQSHDRFINNKKVRDRSTCTHSSLRGLSSHKHKIWKKLKEGQKLYNWLHLAAGRAMIFANISWAWTRQNMSSGFPTKRDSNQSPHLERLPRRSKLRVASLENANDKGADQSAQSMRRLVWAFVVRKPPKAGFLASRSSWLT